MNELKGKREIRKIRELIRKYRKEGYEIRANYSHFERPRSIAGFLPDLIVKKEDREIVIEVVSDESLPYLEAKLKHLSEYATERDKTDFELVVTNPLIRISKEEKSVLRKYLLEDLQRNLLLEARQQYDEGNFLLSFTILYRLLESLLKELAMKKRVIERPEEVPTTQLNSILLEQKVLAPDDSAFLKEIFNYRNRIIHGLEKVEKKYVREYIAFVSTLLKAVK